MSGADEDTGLPWAWNLTHTADPRNQLNWIESDDPLDGDPAEGTGVIYDFAGNLEFDGECY